MRATFWLAAAATLAWLPTSATEPKPKHCSADASNEIELPESLHGQSTDGTLLFRVVIGQDGCTQDVRVVKGIGKKIDQAVTDAVQSWRFEPAMRNGKPLKVLVELSLKIVERDGRLYVTPAAGAK